MVEYLVHYILYCYFILLQIYNKAFKEPLSLYLRVLAHVCHFATVSAAASPPPTATCKFPGILSRTRPVPPIFTIVVSPGRCSRQIDPYRYTADNSQLYIYSCICIIALVRFPSITFAIDVIAVTLSHLFVAFTAVCLDFSSQNAINFVLQVCFKYANIDVIVCFFVINFKLNTFSNCNCSNRMSQYSFKHFPDELSLQC